MKLVATAQAIPAGTPKKPRKAATADAPPARLVTIPMAAARIGLTEKAIRRKIEVGKWLQGREYLRAPDGGLFVDLEAFYAWVAGKAKPH